MKTEIKSIECTELSKEEYVTIHGGESAWYWIAYGSGVVAREYKEFAIDAYVFIQSNRRYGGL